MANHKDEHRKRNVPVKFMATADEKRLYDVVGAEEAEDMSKWIRQVLKAELKRLNKWTLNEQTTEQ